MLNVLFSQVTMWLHSVETKEEGQGLIEYALIVLLIALAVITILGTLGGQINTVFTNISNSLGAELSQ